MKNEIIPQSKFKITSILQKACKDMTISRKMLSYSLHKFSSLTINFSLFFSLSVDEDFCFVVAADPGADGGDTVI